ncbi:MAG TPA: tripartite tricarboxylate transporter substrate binding protein [Burkholderiales bacterium]|jgi:tripartite-type tricarboxylate transporter receptor subunit TctC|nr:tripartite tricarboxylate transporter substrate binding protein [Burkholderiales bacterium]
MLRLLLLTALLLAPPVSKAQSWPQKPVRVIVPFAPGGASDLMPRLVGEKLTAIWGQPVVIENRPGAAGNIGMEAGAKSPPDGYTLLAAPNGNLVVNPHMYSKLAYDVFKDLAPVTRIAAVQNVLVINAEVPASSMKEFIALARAKPGALNFGSPGNGSQAHVGVELLKMQLGLDLVHLPYQGVGPAMKDLLGGRLQLMLAQVPSALPQIKSGKLRALGVASPTPLATLPDVPTIAAAAGIPGYEAVSWYALMAPIGVSQEIITKAYVDIAKVLQMPDVRERLAGMGAEPSGETPADLAKRIKIEYDRWGEVVRKANIKAD